MIVFKGWKILPSPYTNSQKSIKLRLIKRIWKKKLFYKNVGALKKKMES